MTRFLRRLKSLTIKQKMFAGFGVVLLLLAVIAALTLSSLLSIQRATSRVVEEHQPAVITSMQLSENIKDALGGLGFYLLGKEKIHKAEYLLHMNQAQKLLKKLQSEPAIRDQPKAVELVKKIEQDLERFKSYQDQMFTFAENQDENFPAMSYAAKTVSPVTQQMLQNIAAMIQAEELTGESPRLALLKTFYNMRYAWARLMSGVRAYLGFRGAPALDGIKNHFEYFQEQVAAVKNNYSGALTFEQEAALEEIDRLVTEYRKHVDYVISTHGSDKWRQDAYLFRSEISPLLAQLNTEIKKLGDQQVADIDDISHELVQRSTETAFAVITMLVLAMAAVGLLAWMLATGIIRPMTHAVDTGLQAIGDIMSTFEGRAELIAEISEQAANDEIDNAATTFHIMANTLQKAVTQQQQATEELRTKVNTILDLVRQAAEGDLTGKLTGFEGGDTIDELATGVQAMIDNLNALVTQVQQSGIRVTSSATEIAATAKQQEAAVAEQAASTNQIMATVNEISATSKELVHTMTEVAEVADGTAKAADEGHSALERMEATMQQMREATNSITSKLAVLNEKAGNINNVVTTINKVADQTNLLSLNAAIEAEKAGEYGRGFAVVATEIRRLADQTAVATWDIEQMVKEMQSAVSTGVMGMDKFSEEVARSADEVRQVGGQLVHIIEQVQALTPRFESVNDGMQSQSQAADQISESMTQLNEIAQQTAESVHQSNQSIQQLKDAAHGLQNGVSKFRVSA